MHYYIRHIEAHTEKEGKEMNAWPLGHFACLSMWILRPIQPKIYLFFWRGNTFVLHLCWPAIFYFNIWITFSDEVVSPSGYFPFLYQDPTLERREAQSLRGDKWSLLGNCGVFCPERKLFYQQMPEIGQWTLTVWS